jgi:hypothetical protein
MKETTFVHHCSDGILIWVLFFALPLFADDPIEFGPIQYQSVASRDRVVRLGRAIEKGEVKLQRDSQFGYLPAVLNALGVPQSSQSLVF